MNENLEAGGQSEAERRRGRWRRRKKKVDDDDEGDDEETEDYDRDYEEKIPLHVTLMYLIGRGKEQVCTEEQRRQALRRDNIFSQKTSNEYYLSFPLTSALAANKSKDETRSQTVTVTMLAEDGLNRHDQAVARGRCGRQLTYRRLAQTTTRVRLNKDEWA